MSLSDLTRRLGALRAQFLDGLPARAGEVEAWLSEEREVAELARLAHRLRGVAPSHGLLALGAVAARVEEACRGASRDEVTGEAAALRDALRDAVADAASATAASTTAASTTAASTTAAPIEPAAPSPATSRPLEGWRIVAIDDDPMMRRLLELTLTSVGGARAAIVASPADLLDELRRAPADLVISDLMMPLESGPALLARAAAAGLLEGARVVLLSAAAETDVADRMGAALDRRWVWMSKPFRPPELVRALAALR